MKDKRMHFALWGIGAGFALATGFATVALAQQIKTDMASLNAEASKLDPEDYKFMQPVCTRCHTPSFFLHSRTWSEWDEIFNQMSGYGAVGTQEQWVHIQRYLHRNLTQIDVNDADEDQLSAVLGVDEKTAIEMVRRRSDRKFKSAADVEAVPGIDKARIEAMKPRLLFDEPSGDE